MPVPRLEPGELAPRPEAARPDFGAEMARALDQVGSVESRADESVSRFASGQEQEVHRVMMALSAADLTMRLAVEIRNKAVEAYNELNRMQL